MKPELPGVIAARDKMKRELVKLQSDHDKAARAIKSKYAKIINDLKTASYR